MGFQHFKKTVHEAASRKGGRIKISKGFGKNPALASEAGRKGGIAKHANQGEEPQQREDNTGDPGELVDQLFRDPEVIEVMKRLADE